MRNSIIYLTMIVILISFISIACTGEEASSDKNAKKDADKTATADDQQNGDPAVDGTDETAENSSLAGETGDAAGIEPGIEGTHDIPGDDVSQDGLSTTSASDITSMTTDDGTTVVVDSEGNVIETTDSADGSDQAASGIDNAGATPSLGTSSAAGIMGGNAGAGPGANAGAGPGASSTEDAVDKTTLTRGGVNIKDKVAIMKTNFGDMYIFFFTKAAPNHARNFIYLAEKDFFKDTKFHRIKPGFMAQGGKPRADWTEDIPQLKLEIDPKLEAKHIPGAFSAARTSDPNSATSQFFLVFSRSGAQHLDRQYTVYGQMFKGFDVLKKIEGIKVGPNPQMPGEVSKPLQDVIILDVVIEDGAKYKQEIDKWKAQNG